MQISAVIGDEVVARCVSTHAERPVSKSFLLAVAVSALIWAVLGIATTISVSWPVVPELLNFYLSN